MFLANGRVRDKRMYDQRLVRMCTHVSPIGGVFQNNIISFNEFIFGRWQNTLEPMLFMVDPSYNCTCACVVLNELNSTGTLKPQDFRNLNAKPRKAANSAGTPTLTTNLFLITALIALFNPIQKTPPKP